MPNKESFFSNYDYMKMRRPESFSDSYIVSDSTLGKSQFDYHLETLTSRGQHQEFEHFVKCLAEATICPNLLPQTGPTGGGDSKVDSETIPVADEISERWYMGEANAGKERWAFAISAKKEWKSKLYSDVKKIVETGRPYTKIFFVSNQYISDKKRAASEDDLSNQYGKDVRVLDRSWIIDKTFTQKLEHIAIDILEMSGAIQEIKSDGPIDTQRKKELEELEEKINNSNCYSGIEDQLIADALRAAIISRELELNFFEVHGRFERALRLAKKYGNNTQLFKVYYQYAWTSAFWLEEMQKFDELYDQAEALAIKSDNAFHVEKLCNLWNVINASARFNPSSDTDLKVSERATRLRDKLKVFLAQNNVRPSAAALAEFNLIMMDITEKQLTEETPPLFEEEFLKLKNVFELGCQLSEFPFESYAKVITELGQFYPDSEAFDSLYDIVISEEARRKQDESEGIALLQRGLQKLKAQNKYIAIRYLGRAQNRLMPYEAKNALVQSMLGLGHAYKKAGLLWASYASYLAVISKSMPEVANDGELNSTVLFAFKELLWVELLLGRLTNTLFIYENFVLCSRQLGIDVYESDSDYFDVANLDGIISLLLLQSSDEQVRTYSKLASYFSMIGFIGCEISSLYMMGQNNYLIESGYFESEEDLTTFFSKVSSQPVYRDLPDRLEIYHDNMVTFQSDVLGSKTVFEVNNNTTSIQLAETILATLEVFLATSLMDCLIPIRDRSIIRICPSKRVTSDDELQIQMSDDQVLMEIRHSPNFAPVGVKSIEKVNRTIFDIICSFLPRIAHVRNSEEFIEKIENEELLGRSSYASSLYLISFNVLGSDSWRELKYWDNRVPETHFEYQRATEWKAVIPDLNEVSETEKEFLVRDEDSHSNYTISSIIEPHFWDKAGWCGTIVGVPPVPTNNSALLGFMFDNKENGIKAFEYIRQKIGAIDTEEQIRVVLIRGIDKENPFHYRVGLSEDLEKVVKDTSKKFIQVTRYNTMTPENNDNFVMLENYCSRCEGILLLPASKSSDSPQPDLHYQSGIQIRTIQIRDAWEIGLNDPDTAVIKPSDNPIIPKKVKGAPVLEVLEYMRSRREKN